MLSKWLLAECNTNWFHLGGQEQMVLDRFFGIWAIPNIIKGKLQFTILVIVEQPTNG